MGIWTKKNMADLMKEADGVGEVHKLSRSLSTFNLFTLGVGGVIGAGIFVLTGNAAAQYAGPAVVLSFILAGTGCLFAALCYAEFASMIPIAGSAYTYSYVTLGELFAWIIGWDLLLEYLFAASTVAVGWSGYFGGFLSLFGLYIPPEFSSAPFMLDLHGDLAATGTVFNLPAVLIVLAITTLLVLGIQLSAFVNNLMVATKVTIVIMIILFGSAFIHPDYWVPFVPENTGVFGQFGWSGVLRGAGVIFFAYIGFDSVSTAAQEAKTPQKSMPIAIVGSLLFCTLLYILMSLVLTGISHYQLLNVPHPVTIAIEQAGKGLAWLNPFVTLAAIAGLATVILVMLLGQSRVLFAMAKDGLLPSFMGKVHPRFHTPYVATLSTGFAAAGIAAFFPIGLLGELVSIGTLLAFVIVCASVLVLRYRDPGAHRPFKTPLFPIVPILGILVCGYLMSGLPLDTWIRLALWMAIGMVIYTTYGRFRSRRALAEGTAS
jgi:APA family basic amino acid/polyamine antiporter